MSRRYLLAPLVVGLIVGSAGCASAPEPAARSAAKGPLAPSAENVLAADEDLARALRDNDTDGIVRWLSDDWAVISARGGVGEGKSIFPEGIKTGFLKHTAYEASEPRVRLYENVALVTTKLHNAGTLGGKPFDVMERQTDVWVWRDGGWKCVLTHEAWDGAERAQKQLID